MGIFDFLKAGLIVHGTDDKLVKLNCSRQAQRAYPNAKLHIIEGCAHGFNKKHDAIAMAHLRGFAGRDTVSSAPRP